MCDVLWIHWLLILEEEFYIELNNEWISIKDYRHVEKVWTKFKITYLGDYQDLIKQMMFCYY